MSFFKTRRRKNVEAQQFLMRLLNVRSLASLNVYTDDRGEPRTNFCIGIWVVPLIDEHPEVSAAFAAITKDFSSTGIGVVTNRSITEATVMLCLPSAGRSKFVRSHVRNCRSLGVGWFHYGMEAIELIDPANYAELSEFAKMQLF